MSWYSRPTPSALKTLEYRAHKHEWERGAAPKSHPVRRDRATGRSAPRLAGGEGEGGEAGAGVGDVVGLVVVQRPGEPAAGGALVGPQPVGAAAEGGVGGGDA